MNLICTISNEGERFYVEIVVGKYLTQQKAENMAKWLQEVIRDKVDEIDSLECPQ